MWMQNWCMPPLSQVLGHICRKNLEPLQKLNE